MQGIICQDHIAESFQQALAALGAVSIHSRSDLYFTVRDAIASVRSAHFMRTCEAGFPSAFRPYLVQFLAIADQLDAVPEVGADPDLIVEAAAALRLLACLLTVDGADTGTGQAQRRTVTGAALATPHE